MSLIAIVLPDLRVGGVERVMVNLANDWIERGFDVDMVLISAHGELLEALDAAVRVFDLGGGRFRKSVRPLKNYLKSRNPVAVISSLWPVTSYTVIAAKLASYRGWVLISDHSLLSLSYSNRGLVHRLLLRLSIRLTYPLADVRIGVSRAVNMDSAALGWLSEKSFQTIYNPVINKNREVLEVPEQLDKGKKWIISVGTFKPVKRYDLLLDALCRLKDTSVNLCLLGDGPLRGALETQIQELGLNERVILPGFVPVTEPWYAGADLFVLCSDHEGFGNVIVEALGQGVPVVSTCCPGGPREILGDGEFGELVPVDDVDALAAVIDRVLEGPVDHNRLKIRAQEFSVDEISRQYLAAMRLIAGDKVGVDL